MATHSSILAWKNPMDRGAWQATVHGAANSQKRLKQLSTYTIAQDRSTCEHVCPTIPVKYWFLLTISLIDIFLYGTIFQHSMDSFRNMNVILP